MITNWNYIVLGHMLLAYIQFFRMYKLLHGEIIFDAEVFSAMLEGETNHE